MIIAGSHVRMALMFAPWAWLLVWFIFHEQTGCLALSLLMFPVIALIALNILEVKMMQKRAFARMYLVDASWLGQLLTSKFMASIWAVIKAIVFTFILFLEASDWSRWIWVLLLLDIPLLAVSYNWLNRILQRQVRQAQSGIVSRRILVSLNTALLAIIIASGQFLTDQPDYRQYSWQETITHAAGASRAGCEIIAPLARLKSIKDALGWRLAASELGGLQSMAAAIMGWCIFLLSSSLSIWAFSRMLSGSMIRQPEFRQLILGRHETGL